MNQIVTSSSTDLKNIKFTWVEPANRGDTITEYEVNIFSITFNTYFNSISLCNYTYPNLDCEIPHTTI